MQRSATGPPGSGRSRYREQQPGHRLRVLDAASFDLRDRLGQRHPDDLHVVLALTLGLPVGDLGIVNAIQRLYRLRKRPDAKRVLKMGEAWKPYRSVASWYLWQTLRNEPLAKAAGSPKPSRSKSRAR